MRPEFVDNHAGNTVAVALAGYLDELRNKLAKPIELRIASGYFNPGGYRQVAARLAGVHKIRLLLGAEPVPPPAIPLRMPGEPKGPEAEEQRFRNAIQSHDAALRRDRDLLPFDLEQDELLRDMVDRIRSGFLEVRRYENAFLHGKCYLFGTDEGTLVGSSNFTAAGLTSNLELNLGAYQPGIVAQAGEWFERLWGEAKPYDLAALYEARFQPHPPYVIYLRFLWELFRKDLGAAEARRSSSSRPSSGTASGAPSVSSTSSTGCSSPTRWDWERRSSRAISSAQL